MYGKNQVSSSGIGKFEFLELSNEVKNVHFKSKCKKPLTLHGGHNFSVIGPYNFLQWNLRFLCAPVQGHARPTWPGWPGWLNL